MGSTIGYRLTTAVPQYHTSGRDGSPPGASTSGRDGSRGLHVKLPAMIPLMKSRQQDPEHVFMDGRDDHGYGASFALLLF